MWPGVYQKGLTPGWPADLNSNTRLQQHPFSHNKHSLNLKQQFSELTQLKRGILRNDT